MSLAKLTAVSTKTLSLILERQRLKALPSHSSSDGTTSGSTLHYPQIKRSLNQVREGILALEAKEGSSADVTRLLRSQYERMRGMLWEEERAEIPSLEGNRISTSRTVSPELPAQTRQSARDSLLSQPIFAPYTDDPEQGLAEPPEPATLLQVQRLMMDEQDQRLDELSSSVNRQHHISLQINDELDVHHGLLEGLDSDLDRTDSRLRKARRKLDTFAQGVKENGSVVVIGIIIFILLILIIRFKT